MSPGSWNFAPSKFLQRQAFPVPKPATSLCISAVMGLNMDFLWSLSLLVLRAKQTKPAVIGDFACESGNTGRLTLFGYCGFTQKGRGGRLRQHRQSRLQEWAYSVLD